MGCFDPVLLVWAIIWKLGLLHQIRITCARAFFVESDPETFWIERPIHSMTWSRDVKSMFVKVLGCDRI